MVKSVGKLACGACGNFVKSVKSLYAGYLGCVNISLCGFSLCQGSIIDFSLIEFTAETVGGEVEHTILPFICEGTC